MSLFLLLAYFYFFFTVTSTPNVDPDNQPSSSTRFLIAFSVVIVILSQTLPLLLHYPINFLKLFIGFMCYLFMIPTYVNMLTIYAYCNTNDISWGTKGLTGGAKAGILDNKFKKFRYNMLVLWIFFNMIGSYVLTQLVRRGAA